MSVPRVKICGVRRLEDALVAAEAGADYIGMVFVPGRRRKIEPTVASEISEGLRQSSDTRPMSVGLFGDQPLTEVLETIEAAGLDGVQLCGDESIDYCRGVLEHAHVIKVLHVPNDAAPDSIEALGREIDAYSAVGCVVTLDSDVVGLHGGTGVSFDWSVAAGLAESGRRFMLAGGLTPENVAVAVDRAKPWGVDVSSGVETNGKQDQEKIRNFIANARSGRQSVEKR